MRECQTPALEPGVVSDPPSGRGPAAARRRRPLQLVALDPPARRSGPRQGAGQRQSRRDTRRDEHAASVRGETARPSGLSERVSRLQGRRDRPEGPCSAPATTPATAADQPHHRHAAPRGAPVGNSSGRSRAARRTPDIGELSTNQAATRTPRGRPAPPAMPEQTPYEPARRAPRTTPPRRRGDQPTALPRRLRHQRADHGEGQHDRASTR